MSEYQHAASDGIDNIVRDLRVNQLFAIDRRSRNNYTVRINDRGGTAERNSVVGSHSIGENEIALVFNRTRQRQDSQMLHSNERPR